MSEDSLIIEATEIEILNSCPRRWFLSYHRNLEPARESWETSFGTLVHQSLEAYYRSGRTVDPGDVFERLVEERRPDGWLAGDPDAPPLAPLEDSDWGRLMAVGAKLMHGYPDFDRSDPLGDAKVLYTEVAYDLPVEGEVFGEHVEGILRGRMDLILEMPNGSLVIEDHKTCKQFPNEKTLHMAKQPKIYMMALSRMVDQPVAAACFDHIRKQDPDTVRTQPVYKRTLIPFRQEEVDSYYDDVLWALWLREKVRSLPLAKTPTNVGFHCGTLCPFSEPCSAIRELGPVQAEAMLEGLYVQRTEERPGVLRR